MKSFCWNCFQVIESSEAPCPRCGQSQCAVPGDFCEKLLRALNHPIGETRRRAAFLLGEKRVSEAVANLASLVAGDSDPYVAKEAVSALAKIGSSQALHAIERAASHRSFMVREGAVQALAAAGGRWTRLARRIADSDLSPSVKSAAGTVTAKSRRLARRARVGGAEKGGRSY